MNSNELTNRMGTAPILKLLLKMSLPMVFSMLISALYNIVDSIFVAQVSEDAFTAVTLVFPMQTLILAFALGVGVGTNAIVSRRLGEKNVDNASQCAQTGLFLALVISAFFTVTGYGLSYAYIAPFTEDNPVVRQLAMQYLSIVMCMSFGLMLEILGEKVLQSTGNMKIPMITQLIGAITNLLLDPLFIFVFKMGVIGAAIATVTGQIFGMIFVLIYIAKHNLGIQVFFKNFRLKWKNVAAIINVGIPTLVVNAVTAFTTMILNGILKSIHSLTAVTVLGTYFKLQSFVFMPVFGITQGAFPIMSYNFGAHNKKRFIKTFEWGVILSTIIMAIGTLIFQLLPRELMLIFNAEGELLSMGTIALKRISWCFLGAAFGIIITSMLQTLGRGVCSLLMSLLRQIVLLIPAVWIFGEFLGIDAAWWGYPFAEGVTLVVFIPIAIYFIKKDFQRVMLEDEINKQSNIIDGTTDDDYSTSEQANNMDDSNVEGTQDITSNGNVN